MLCSQTRQKIIPANVDSTSDVLCESCWRIIRLCVPPRSYAGRTWRWWNAASHVIRDSDTFWARHHRSCDAPAVFAFVAIKIISGRENCVTSNYSRRLAWIAWWALCYMCIIMYLSYRFMPMQWRHCGFGSIQTRAIEPYFSTRIGLSRVS